MQTIRMIAKNLAKSADGDVPAGEQMAYAPTSPAWPTPRRPRSGAWHGPPAGGRLGVAHGVANGILLAPVMEYNKDFTGEKYRDIADAFGVEDAYTGDLETVREEAVQAVHKLTVDLKNPTTISEVGATEAIWKHWPTTLQRRVHPGQPASGHRRRHPRHLQEPDVMRKLSRIGNRMQRICSETRL